MGFATFVYLGMDAMDTLGKVALETMGNEARCDDIMGTVTFNPSRSGDIALVTLHKATSKSGCQLCVTAPGGHTPQYYFVTLCLPLLTRCHIFRFGMLCLFNVVSIS